MRHWPWTNERHEGAESTVAPAPTGNAVRWHATRPGTAAWHLQLGSGKVLLEPGECYRVAFRGRSESGSRVTLSATQAGGEWANLGLGEECALAGEWRQFSWRLFPSRVDPAAGSRFVFSLGNRPGVVELADFSCREESPGQLLPGEDPAANSVPVPTAGAGERVRRDYLAFLADVELAFGRGMRGFLREELGCRALVVDSQVLFGGVLGARREARVSDFVADRITGYFNAAAHPAKDGLRPAGALVYRLGLVAPAPVATVVLVALDGRPVAESAKLLLTALRRAENRDMGWTADRRSVADRWGEGPVRVLGLEAELAMPAGTRWTVTPLDPAGQRRAPLQQAAATVRIEPAHATIWWLLER